MLDYNKPVKVYYNLRRKVWSVQQIVNGRPKVVAHLTDLQLRDVRFTVSQAGRERVLREGVKNVHAFARGYLVKPGTMDFEEYVVEVTYNPFKYTSFMAIHNGSIDPIETANSVWLCKVGGKAKVLAS